MRTIETRNWLANSDAQRAEPVTAIESMGMWRTLTWRQLAGIAESAGMAASAASNGALEFIETLKEYGGS